MRTLSACLSQPVVTVVLQVTVISSRIDFTHTRGSSATWSFAHCDLPKIVTSHRAVSYVTPHLSITPTAGTCTPSLTRPTSLSSDPLLGDLQPCADLRQIERGSLAEPPSFTGYERNKDHKPFTEDRHLSEYQDLAEHEDLRVNPLFFHRPSIASTYDSAESIATPPPDQIRGRLEKPTWMTNNFVFCWLPHCTYRSERQMRNDRKIITL